MPAAERDTVRMAAAVGLAWAMLPAPQKARMQTALEAMQLPFVKWLWHLVPLPIFEYLRESVAEICLQLPEILPKLAQHTTLALHEQQFQGETLRYSQAQKTLSFNEQQWLFTEIGHSFPQPNGYIAIAYQAQTDGSLHQMTFRVRHLIAE